MRVFLGSSSSQDSMRTLRNVAMLIEAENAIPCPWNRSVFPLGTYVLDSLINISKHVDAAILIFNEDDTFW